MKLLLVVAALLAVSAAQFVAPYVAHTAVAPAVVAPFSYEGTHLYRARRSPIYPVAASTAIHAPVVSTYGAYPYVHAPVVYRHRRGVVAPLAYAGYHHAPVAPTAYSYPHVAHSAYLYRHRRGVVAPVTGVVAPVARVSPIVPIAYSGLTHPTYAHASFSSPYSYHY